MLTEDSSFPLLQIASDTTQKYHQPMLISEGKLKLDVLKQVLGKAGYHAKFRGGMLVCDDGVVLKRSMNNEIIVEGVLSNNYFRIRKLLYEQYKVL
jgi:cleavage and polyadenylation specificity factor subunit 2